MPETPQRFDHIRRSARIGRLFVILGVTVFLVIAGYLFVSGTDGPTGFQFDSKFGLLLTSVGLIGLAFLAAAFFVFLWDLLQLLLKVEANSFRSYGMLRDLESNLLQQRESLQQIAENVQLSDAARAITSRGKDRTALRLAINEEIIRGDWEAAYALVEQLEARHGYRNEAARLRAEVDQSRMQSNQDRAHEAVAQVMAAMNELDWDRARIQMDRLLATHPNNAEVAELPQLFSKRRGMHKRRLLKEWDECVQRNEIDHGIAVLKQLDQYLTPNEAAALEESARGVFRAKLHNLGVQFSMAVAEHNWSDALEVGRQIVDEFPNTRMAQEVKDRIHVLTKRAEGSASSDQESAEPAVSTR